MAEKLKLAFHSTKVDVKAVQQKERKTLEEAGREVRFGYLEKVALEISAQKIAVAHNLDDQARRSCTASCAARACAA